MILYNAAKSKTDVENRDKSHVNFKWHNEAKHYCKKETIHEIKIVKKNQCKVLYFSCLAPTLSDILLLHESWIKM